MERVRSVRADWHDGVEKKVREAKIDLVRATGAFSGVRSVRGGGREVRAPRVVIDTGTSPSLPALRGLEDTPYLTNKTFFDQAALPERLIVIGGGYIGLELGQGAQRLGSAVTILDPSERVMAREEADATSVLEQSLRRDGVTLRLGCKPSAVEHDGTRFSLSLDSGETLVAEGLLVAAGRNAETAALATEKSGIERRPGGYIQVDDFLETTCAGVYALGDAAGQPAFTHVSWEDFRRLRSTFAGQPRRRDDRVLSYATFTEPQLARTGYSEAEAKKNGIEARAVTLPLENVARGAEWDLELGFFRLVIDQRSEKIVGATFVGYEAGELIHIVGVLIEMGATWRDLDRFVAIHPTFAEGLPSLARLLE